MTAETEPVVIDLATLPMATDRGRAWEMVRSAGPVVRMRGIPVLTRRADVLEALRNPELFSSEQAFEMLGSPLPLVPIAFDPPTHTRYRKILQPLFSPRRLAELLPSLRRQAVAMVDGLAALGRCDAVADIAIPYPSQVFLTLFGFPLTDRDRLIGWKDAVISLASNVGREDVDLTPALELFSYVSEAVTAKRAAPAEDMLSELLHGQDPLDDQEAIGLCFLFVLAGLDTVTSAIGSALWKLAVRPDLRDLLARDPDRIEEYVEELIRLEPPVPTVPRVTTKDLDIGGVRLEAGTLVYLCLGATNREESAEEPLPPDVELEGQRRRHWGFGGGPHRCLGSHLARMELKLVLSRWLEKVPHFELAPGFEARIRYPADTFAFESLPLVYPSGPGR